MTLSIHSLKRFYKKLKEKPNILRIVNNTVYPSFKRIYEDYLRWVMKGSNFNDTKDT